MIEGRIDQPEPVTGDSSNPPVAMLRVAVCAGLQLSLIQPGSPTRAVPLPNRKARAMLAYLALGEPMRASRDQLCGLLWGEVGDRQARTSLRQALFETRLALGRAADEIVLSRRDDIALDPARISTDLGELIASVRDGEPIEGADSIAGGTSLLLSGYDDLSPIFGDWLQTSRRAQSARLMQALEQAYIDPRLLPQRRRRLAELTLRIDPVNEQACRVVMEIAARAGETSIALRAYSQLYSAMDTELDMEPSDATQALVAEIKSGRFEAMARPAGLGPRAPEPSVAGPSDMPRLPAQAADQSGIPVVAVMPFRGLGPDPTPAFFAEGVLEDVVGQLTALREPIVISSNTTRRLINPDLDTSAQALRVGASYVVTGTTRAADGAIRLSVELSDARSDVVLWKHGYSINSPACFDVHDDIAARIAYTLMPRIQQNERLLGRRRPPGSMTAYQILQQARERMYTLTPEAMQDALELLERARSLDPHYAPIHIALANCHSLRLGQHWSRDPQLDFGQMYTAIRVAIESDSALGTALAMLGHRRAISDRQYDAALKLIDQATINSPNDAETLMWGVSAIAYAGQPDAAIARGERALALSPDDPFRFRMEHFLSMAYYVAGDFSMAASLGLQSFARNCNYHSNMGTTAAALVGAGRIDEAREIGAIFMKADPGARVSQRIHGFPFSTEQARLRYGHHLVLAGMPAQALGVQFF